MAIDIENPHLVSLGARGESASAGRRYRSGRSPYLKYPFVQSPARAHIQSRTPDPGTRLSARFTQHGARHDFDPGTH
jgi:hypothetical protein